MAELRLTPDPEDPALMAPEVKPTPKDGRQDDYAAQRRLWREMNPGIPDPEPFRPVDATQPEDAADG